MPKLIFEKFVKNVRENKLIRPTDRVLAAVSCGPDSVCMIHLLTTLKKKLGFDLGIAYINHNLRPKEVKNEIKFILKTALALKLPVFIENIRINKTKSGIESEARKLRYKALQNIAEKNDYNKIATGHTLDDCAETVLLNLTRSRCEEGPSAIPVIREITGKKIFIIRPVITLKKNEILKYLKKTGKNYCIDSSNADISFSRNLIRHRIMPILEKINPKIPEHLLNLSKWSEIKEAYFDKLSENASNSIIKNHYNYLRLDLKSFLKYNEYLQWKILKHVLIRFQEQNPSKAVEEIFRFLNSGKKKLLFKNLLIKQKGNCLTLKKK